MSRPLSPSIRPLMPGLFFSQVCLLAFLCGIFAFRYFWPGLSALVILLCLDWKRAAPLAVTLALILFFGLGYLYMGARTKERPEEPAWLAAYLEDDEGWSRYEGPRPDKVRIRARVESVTRLPLDRTRIILSDARPAEEGGIPGTGLFAWTIPTLENPPLAGQTVEGPFRFARIRGSVNPGVFQLESYWGDQGVWWRARNAWQDITVSGRPGFMESWRESLYVRFMGALPGKGASTEQGAAFLPALIFGDRSLMDPDVTDLIARSTLAHSLALSGLHLGYALAVGYAAAWAAGRLFPRLWLRIPRPVLSVLLGLPLAVAYLWLGRAPLSLQRSAMMLAFWALLLFLRKPRAFLDGVLAALALFVLLDPTALFNLGLQLSVLCVSTLALAAPWMPRFAPPPKGKNGPGRRMLRAFGSYLLVSLVIQVGMVPLSAKAFGSVGLLFPLNALWLPVLGAVIMPLAFLGLVLGGAGLASAASLVLALASYPCQWLVDLISALDRSGLLWSPATLRPHWLSMLGYWLLCLALPLLWHAARTRKPGTAVPLKKALALVLAGILLTVGPMVRGVGRGMFSPPKVRLRVLDVGPGQAVCIEWSDGRREKRVLVDGGLASPAFDSGRGIVAPALTHNNPPRLEGVIYSHPDADHLGGLVYILSAFRVGWFAGNGQKPSPALEERLNKAMRQRSLTERPLAAGDVVPLDRELALEVLWPEKESLASGVTANNASLVLRLVWRGEPLAILSGDVEKSGLRAIVARAEEGALKTPVLIVPHHGSATSLFEKFLDEVRPEMGLVSCAYGNMWRFPSRAVRQAFEERGIPLHTTADSGQMVVEWEEPSGPPRLTLVRKTEP